MTRRAMRRIIEALGMAASHTWNEMGYRVVALHIGNASGWRWRP